MRQFVAGGRSAAFTGTARYAGFRAPLSLSRNTQSLQSATRMGSASLTRQAQLRAASNKPTAVQGYQLKGKPAQVPPAQRAVTQPATPVVKADVANPLNTPKGGLDVGRDAWVSPRLKREAAAQKQWTEGQREKIAATDEPFVNKRLNTEAKAQADWVKANREPVPSRSEPWSNERLNQAAAQQLQWTREARAAEQQNAPDFSRVNRAISQASRELADWQKEISALENLN